MPPSVNDVKESRTASLLETNVKTSVDEFLRISQNANVSLTREGMGKNVTQVIPYKLKTDRNNFKNVVTPTFYVIEVRIIEVRLYWFCTILTRRLPRRTIRLYRYHPIHFRPLYSIALAEQKSYNFTLKNIEWFRILNVYRWCIPKSRGPGSEQSVPIKLSFSYRYSKKLLWRSNYFPMPPMLLTEKDADLHTLLTCLDNIRCESTSTLRSWAAVVGDLI